MMRKFLLDCKIQELVSAEPWDSSQQDLFGSLLERRQVGSAERICELFVHSDSVSIVDLPLQQITPSADYVQLTGITCVPPYMMEMFNADSLQYLRQAYIAIIPDIADCNLPSMYQCYREIEMCGERIGSTRSRLDRSCFIQAHWVGQGGQVNTPPAKFCLRPGVIDYFLKQHLYSN